MDTASPRSPLPRFAPSVAPLAGRGRRASPAGIRRDEPHRLRPRGACPTRWRRSPPRSRRTRGGLLLRARPRGQPGRGERVARAASTRAISRAASSTGAKRAARLRKHAAIGIPGKTASRWVTRERPRSIASPARGSCGASSTRSRRSLPTGAVLGARAGRRPIAYDMPGGRVRARRRALQLRRCARVRASRPARARRARAHRPRRGHRPARSRAAVGGPARGVARPRAALRRRSRAARAGHAGLRRALRGCRDARAETHGWNPEAMRKAMR